MLSGIASSLKVSSVRLPNLSVVSVTVSPFARSTRYKYIDGTDMVKTKTNTADAETEYGYDYATDKLTGISETDDS